MKVANLIGSSHLGLGGRLKPEFLLTPEILSSTCAPVGTQVLSVRGFKTAFGNRSSLVSYR